MIKFSNIYLLLLESIIIEFLDLMILSIISNSYLSLLISLGNLTIIALWETFFSKGNFRKKTSRVRSHES